MPEQKPEGYDAANLEAMGEAVTYQAAMRQLVLNKLDLHWRSGTVLDFGAGRGDYALAIQSGSAMNVVSLEPDTTLHPHYPVDMPVVSSLADLTDTPVDCAYSLNVLEHIDDDVQALRELAARCQPGAYIFMLVPANPKLWTPMDTLVGHRRRYMPDTLRLVTERAGLLVVEEGWFDRTGYFATRAYQLLHRMGVLKQQGAGTVSKRQIRLFDALFRLSEPVMRGLRLPFGKNCWVLAQLPVSAESLVP